MVSFILIFLFIFGFLIGRRRGFILQLIHLVGFFIAIFVAYRYHAALAEKIRLYIPYPELSPDSTIGMLIQSFGAERIYYAAIAFAILFFGTKIILHIIGSMLDFVAHLPVLRGVNRLLGGILGLLEFYLIAFVVVYVATVVPMEGVQEALQKSTVAKLMVQHTPYLSDWLQTLWTKFHF